jgi:hypothetical protein
VFRTPTDNDKHPIAIPAVLASPGKIVVDPIDADPEIVDSKIVGSVMYVSIRVYRFCALL